METRHSTLPVLTGTFGGAGELDSVAVIAQQVDDAAKIGDTLAEYEVPAELSVTGDDYAVGVRPDDVPRSAFDANGVVDLEVQLSSRRDMWVTYLSVRLVRDASTGTLTWIDPIESLPSNAAKVSARVANGRQVAIKSVPTRIAKERARVKARDLVRMPARYRETYRTTAPGSSRAAAAGICENKYLGDRNVSTTIATSYPVGATKSWLEARSSEGGKYGIGLSTGKGASFTASGTRFVEGAWSFSWTKQSVARSYRIQVNYHKFEKVGLCSGPPLRWTPHIETGGATENTAGVNRPSWNTYCANVARGTWARERSDGADYSYGAAVKFKDVIGVDLSGQKSYSRSHKLVYDIAGSNPKKLCGNNDYPAVAGKLVERKR